MSSHPRAKTKKKTVAQFRAEKEQHTQDLKLGALLASEVDMTLDRYETEAYSQEERYDAMNALLVKANRACVFYFRTISCHVKVRAHTHLGQHILAIAAHEKRTSSFLQHIVRGWFRRTLKAFGRKSLMTWVGPT